FEIPAHRPPQAPAAAPVPLRTQVTLAPAIGLPEPEPSIVPGRGPTRSMTPAIVATVAALALLAAALWLRPWTAHSAVDRFWAPIVDSPGTVLLCVGQRQFLGSSPESPDQYGGDLPHSNGWQHGPEPPITLFRLYYMGSQNVAFPDARTLGRLSGLLYAKGKRYRMQGESSTTFAELRDG